MLIKDLSEAATKVDKSVPVSTLPNSTIYIGEFTPAVGKLYNKGVLVSPIGKNRGMEVSWKRAVEGAEKAFTKAFGDDAVSNTSVGQGRSGIVVAVGDLSISELQDKLSSVLSYL